MLQAFQSACLALGHLVVKKPNLLFMGSPEFAATILRQIQSAGYPICAVYAQPDKVANRGQKMTAPPVAQLAKELGLTLRQPSTLKTIEIQAELASFAPDYIIVAAYGKLLPDAILQAPKKDILNVHASLLPAYRGASPVQQALLDGCTQTGVSIMRVQTALDAGPVFSTKTEPIHQNDTTGLLMVRLAQLGAELLLQTLDSLEIGTVAPQPQNDNLATYTKKITKEAALIHWLAPAKVILGQILAYQPWPVATTILQGKKIKVFGVQLLPSRSGRVPGTLVMLAKNGWTVATGSEDILVTDVQLEGRKRLPAFEVANGLRLVPGLVLGG